ncbi:colicin E3/pyocin S6 family cytotoxin [Pseudomonas aeruginosa]|uniref:colicin E3/pyocin S6 family cytotoxin n=1 Tax=Pseudomonas aeruginosa TaxID=287 RepID=UPI002FC9F356
MHYYPAPATLPAFPDALRAKPKTSIQGGGCSGQPIPDSGLSFSSATAGGNPSLN